MAESGWAALTPARLAESLGVHPTAVYRHFPAWNDLVVAVFDLRLAQIFTAAMASAPPDATPREQILGIMRIFRLATRNDPFLADCIYLILSADTLLPAPSFDAASEQMANLLIAMGVPETDLPAMYQALESLAIGNLLVDFTGHPNHVAHRRQRRRMSGVTAFEQFTRSEAETEAVSDAAFELSARLLLDECERLAAQAR